MLQLTNRRLTLAAMALSVIAVLPASGQTLNEDLKIYSSDGDILDLFGYSIAIDDRVVAVGSPFDDDIPADSGSVYLYDAFTGMLIDKLFPNDAASADRFGWSISMDNGIIAVGAPRILTNDPGSAYLFDASTGVQVAKLTANDAQAGDQFGFSISIANGIVAVGARFDDDAGADSGSAYLFDAFTGVQIAKLIASDAESGDEFGYSNAIDNGVVAVGSYHDGDNGAQSGSAYLFDASTGTQLFKLLPSDGAAMDQFGWSMAIENEVVVVGASELTGAIAGSAYLFDTTTGTQLFKLLPNDAGDSDNFGYSVSIDNGIVAVGSQFASNNSIQTGSAYLFVASTGAQIAKLIASDGTAGDLFGSSIAIANGIVAVGAYFGDGKDGDTGSAYLFNTLPIALLQPQSTIVDAGETASFELVLNDETGVSYQWRHDGVDLADGNNITGTNTTTLQIIAEASDVGFYDCVYSTQTASFLTDQAALGVRPDPNACVADLTNDGILNFFDVSAFLQAFGKGCP
ncbi:MAG: FG-GAP repeat protein [Phycisphaerales bacterium]|nr:FG-GAP repeat protein [Phycisphaerales bacterium]